MPETLNVETKKIKSGSTPDLAPEQKILDEWEQRCHRCGLCCFEKGIDGKGRIIETEVPCRHLDIHTRLCRVYKNRQQIESDCIKLTPEIISQLKWLPKSCAYHKKSEDTGS
ncbi:YkgJ family cysteine cluster protein [Geopsychrobacter electrodiphilus]|uniref:YkgJ family cysteine cluster protein n=1 Tax=Geopsychrobacter electrodiphilus TaxID=225196 RepID=UPI0003698152|nr:YkgJ family cysteine cluster protein [Geopsychrobacter electrodiphilus]